MVLDNTASFTTAGSAAGPFGALIGAGVGLVTDILGTSSAKKQAQALFAQTVSFNQQEFAATTQQLQAAAFEQQVNLANQADRLERQHRLGLDLFQASAAASGVEGNSINAISQTRLMQEGEIRNQVARRLEALAGNFRRQADAASLQMQFNIARAANELSGGFPSSGAVFGGLAKVGSALYQGGVFDKQASVPGFGSPMAGTYSGPLDSVPPGPVPGPAPTTGIPPWAL